MKVISCRQTKTVHFKVRGAMFSHPMFMCGIYKATNRVNRKGRYWKLIDNVGKECFTENAAIESVPEDCFDIPLIDKIRHGKAVDEGLKND